MLSSLAPPRTKGLGHMCSETRLLFIMPSSTQPSGRHVMYMPWFNLQSPHLLRIHECSELQSYSVETRLLLLNFLSFSKLVTSGMVFSSKARQWVSQSFSSQSTTYSEGKPIRCVIVNTFHDTQYCITYIQYIYKILFILGPFAPKELSSRVFWVYFSWSRLC